MHVYLHPLLAEQPTLILALVPRIGNELCLTSFPESTVYQAEFLKDGYEHCRETDSMNLHSVIYIAIYNWL